MNKLAPFIGFVLISVFVAASESFPEWRESPRIGLSENLMAGVSCGKSLGDMSLDMDVTSMEARVDLAASLEVWVRKEINKVITAETGQSANSVKTSSSMNTTGPVNRAQSVTITAKSDAQQVIGQLMKYTWVSDTASVELGTEKYLCVRVVARIPSFAKQ
ncbi:hypothetical protein VQ7734_00925 [Vibrio quintilis]|uniref:Uncharacterized protein n=2 Tax=Vibrio quintilis TaxID=1117707 RepID=A0A1M7YRQ4_9VIBR|nr:hypothetical protein VQ7734_00925 [Vibrio quintilis]